MKPKKILVVEDERLVAEDIAECLRERGFEVCGICKEGQDAIAKAREHRPDLALMDIVLQGEMDGIEVATVLKSELQTPVIFLTAYSQSGILERAKAVEPLGYVVKPFEEGSLLSTVEIALHKARLDRELRKSEEWFSTTLNSIGDGVIATDTEGRIRFLNRLAEQLTGWSTEEAEGVHVEDVFRIINEGTRKKVPNPAMEALETGQIRALANHTFLIQKNEQEIPIDDSGAPIHDREGKLVGAVLVFRDVTEHKEHEKEVKRYQQHLESTVAKRTEDLARRIDLERMVIDISADLIRLNQSCFADGLNEAVQKIGEAMHLDGCGIYEALSSDEPNAGMFKPQAVWAKDPDVWAKRLEDQPGQAHFPWWTRQMEEEGEIVIRDPEDVPEEAVTERAIMAARGVHSMFLLPLGPVDPLKLILVFSSNERRDWSENDRVMFEILAGVFKNVFERRDLEAEQRELQEQLIQSQKLEAIGKLSGGIAHDFNNMLVPIIGYADVVLMNPNLGKNATEIREIRKAAESAASLTRQLLAFSKKQILDKRTLCLNHLIDDMQGMLSRLLGEDIEFKIELAEELWSVEADKGQIEQVLMNLSVNARDAMPGGGCLTIRTRNVSESNGSRSTVLSVEDTGCGMNKDLISRAFDPFFTTKGMEGTGLGLSVVLGIVQQHDGWLKIDSEEGDGSSFVMGLPGGVESASARPTVPVLPSADGFRGTGEHILLVEDEPAVLQFVSRALKRHGYEVVVAMTEAAAIRAFDEAEAPFDLIFTDAKLPDGNGMEVLRHIFEQEPKMKALLSSGYTDDRALVNQARQKGVAFLQKPYGLEELYDTVSKVLQGSRGESEGGVLESAGPFSSATGVELSG